MTQYNLMCHSATHQLIRLDMGYTVNCSAACANNCVNTSQANCSVSCCNSTGCLNDTFVSMMMGPSTGEQMRESFLGSHFSLELVFPITIPSGVFTGFYNRSFFLLNDYSDGNNKNSRHYSR